MFADDEEESAQSKEVLFTFYFDVSKMSNKLPRVRSSYVQGRKESFARSLACHAAILDSRQRIMKALTNLPRKTRVWAAPPANKQAPADSWDQASRHHLSSLVAAAAIERAASLQCNVSILSLNVILCQNAQPIVGIATTASGVWLTP